MIRKTENLLEQTRSLNDLCYVRAAPLVLDFLAEPMEEVLTQYKLSAGDLGKILYFNLPNVLKHEPELISKIDPKKLSKQLPNKYATCIRDWICQFVAPAGLSSISFSERIRPRHTSQPRDREARLLVLEGKTNAVLREDKINVVTAEQPQFETVQVFVCVNTLGRWGVEDLSCQNLDTIIWRILPADRLDVLCYTLSTFPDPIKVNITNKVSGGRAGAVGKTLLSKKVTDHIVNDIKQLCTFTMYKNTYTIYSNESTNT